jgi:hypothetical protein
MRGFALRYTKFDPKVIKQIRNFGAFTTDVTPATINKGATLLAENGLIPRRPALSSYVYLAH